MRKGVLYAVVLFIITMIALIPWLDGMLFKKNYLHLIDLINQDSRIRIDVIEYHEGWFNSFARVRIALDNELVNLKHINIPQINFSAPISFTIDEKINHGPVLYNRIQKKLEFGYANIITFIHLSNEEETSLLTDGNTDYGIMQIYTLSEFDGDWHGLINIPSLNFSSQSLGKVTWGGLNGNFKLVIHRNHIKHVITQMQIGSLDLNAGPNNTIFSQIDIKPIQYTYDGVHEKTGLWAGNSSLYTDGVSIKESDKEGFSANKLSINNAFGFGAGTLYNANLSIYMKNLTTSIQGFPVFTKVQATFSANNFSSQGLYDYIKFIKNKKPENSININIKTLENYLARTVSPISSLYGDISSNSSFGQFSCHTKTVWKQDAPAPNSIEDIITHSYTEIYIRASDVIVNKVIEIYGQKINASSAASKKAALIKSSTQVGVTKQNNTQTSSLITQSPQKLITDLLRIGYINKENNDYFTILTIDGGVWKINGRVLSSEKTSESPSQSVKQLPPKK